METRSTAFTLRQQPASPHPLPCLQVYFSGPPLLLGMSPTHGDDFSALEPQALKAAVCVWPLTLSTFLPPDNVMVRLEGLVLAPPCGGDLPRSVADHLGEKWTKTLPIVVAMQVTSWCGASTVTTRSCRADGRSESAVVLAVWPLPW